MSIIFTKVTATDTYDPSINYLVYFPFGYGTKWGQLSADFYLDDVRHNFRLGGFNFFDAVYYIPDNPLFGTPGYTAHDWDSPNLPAGEGTLDTVTLDTEKRIDVRDQVRQLAWEAVNFDAIVVHNQGELVAYMLKITEALNPSAQNLFAKDIVNMRKIAEIDANYVAEQSAISKLITFIPFGRQDAAQLTNRICAIAHTLFDELFEIRYHNHQVSLSYKGDNNAQSVQTLIARIERIESLDEITLESVREAIAPEPEPTETPDPDEDETEPTE